MIDQIATGGSTADIINGIAQVLTSIFQVAGVVAVIVIILAGRQMLTSMGNASAVETARKSIQQAIVGLVIVLSASGITSFALNIFNGSVNYEGQNGAGGIFNLFMDNTEKKRKTIDATAIKATAEQLDLNVGNSRTISITFEPANTTKRKLTYESSNPEVATVTSGGSVSALKNGTTEITVTAESGVSTKVAVTVSELVLPETITISPSSHTLDKGKTAQFTAKVEPENAIKRDVTWISSDGTIATINSNGVVTAKKQGEVTITARTQSGLTATAKVKVEDSELATGPSWTIGVGELRPIGPSRDGKKLISNSTAVLHVDHQYKKQFEYAGQNGFYAAECDIFYGNGGYYCHHDGSGYNDKFDDVMAIAKNYGMRVVIDKGTGSSDGFIRYVTSNGWQNDVIIQVSSPTAATMTRLNGIAGTTLEYWGLIMGSGEYNAVMNNPSNLQSLGLRAVNIQHDLSPQYATSTKNAGYEVCIFAWHSIEFEGSHNYKTYDVYNPDYYMTDEGSRATR